MKTGATVNYVQDYAGGLEYRQNGTGSKRVEAIYHDEGRYFNLNVEVNNTLSWQKQYTLRDHLGNSRLTFTDKDGDGIVEITGNAGTSDVLQEEDYYPFGLSFEGPWIQDDAGRDNGYLYNNKELNGDHGLNWYDYGARWYMADIGRWGQVDPLAEKYLGLSPYNYTANNPILLIDLDGKEFINPYENYKQYQEETNRLKNNLQEAKESGNKKAIKSARNEIKSFGRDKINGVEKYEKVNDLIAEFRSAVGEEEFNYYNNLSFKGKSIDIVVTLDYSSANKDGSEEGSTTFKYILGTSVSAATGEKSTYVSGIEGNSMQVTLYKQNLSSFANELGDVKFGIERPETVMEQRNTPYWEKSSTKFSFAYEAYVMGERPTMPNAQSNEY